MRQIHCRQMKKENRRQTPEGPNRSNSQPNQKVKSLCSFVILSVSVPTSEVRHMRERHRKSVYNIEPKGEICHSAFAARDNMHRLFAGQYVGSF
jgi:hypothetical protein